MKTVVANDGSEVFVLRLKNAWRPDEGSFELMETDIGADPLRFGCRFKLSGNDVQYCVGEHSTFIYLFQGIEHEEPPKLWCRIIDGKAWVTMRETLRYNTEEPDKWERDKVFANEWMNAFRRGCYLSGVPIESTSHEQMEWNFWFSGKEDITP